MSSTINSSAGMEMMTAPKNVVGVMLFFIAAAIIITAWLIYKKSKNTDASTDI